MCSSNLAALYSILLGARGGRSFMPLYNTTLSPPLFPQLGLSTMRLVVREKKQKSPALPLQLPSIFLLPFLHTHAVRCVVVCVCVQLWLCGKGEK